MGRKPKEKVEEEVENVIKRQKMPDMFCLSCGKKPSGSKFYVSKNPKYKYMKKLPWCSSCLKKKYDEYYDLYGSEKQAMYELCRFMDMPFLEKVYAIAFKNYEDGKDLYQAYITYYNLISSQLSERTFLDGNYLNTRRNSDVQNIEQEDVPEQYIIDWGEGFNLKEYEFLEHELSECKKTLKCDTWSEETLLREICIKKLDVRNRRRAAKDTSEALKELQNLMKTCAVDPAKTSIANGGKSLDAFGIWIKDIEEKSPAEWYKDKKKFKDVDNIEDYLKKYITRPIKNFITGSRDFNVDKDVMVDFGDGGK